MGRRKTRMGANQQKVLLLLSAGLALGLTHNPSVQWRIIRNMPVAWKEINHRGLHNATKQLYDRDYIHTHKQGNTYQLTLSRAGREAAAKMQLAQMTVKKPRTWDGLWRVVIYDVPEAQRDLRSHVSYILKELGFLEIQKSVFIHPYECRKEIERIIKTYDATEFIYYMVVQRISNERNFCKHFNV